MNALNLISPIIPPLKDTDTPEKALAWMEEFRLSELPVVHQTNLVGVVSEDLLLDVEDIYTPFNQQNIPYKQFGVHQNEHLLKVLKLLSDQNVSLIPVLDDAGAYIGSITYQNIILALGQLTTNLQHWAILVLEVPFINYSLAEIAQIVETNQAKILSVYTSELTDSNLMEVTLTINTDDLTNIIESFYRYRYQIKDSYHLDKFKESNQDRLDFFMNFLKI